MSGLWIVVCGASGSGKDSVIEAARQALGDQPAIVFARRMVSRPTHAGSDHDPVSLSDFLALQHSGSLSWHWQAHGYHYGIAGRYAQEVAQGRRVVVNGSREHVAALATSPDLRVVLIEADPLTLGRRLVQRGREDTEAVAARLARNKRLDTLPAHISIDNTGELADAGRRLAAYLRQV